jgi:hypothetical protein
MNASPFLDALTLAVLNLCAAVILTALHVVNAVYDWPNPFVTVAAPLAAAVFFVLTAIWFLELARRARRSRSAVRLNPRRAICDAEPAPLACIPLGHGPARRRWARFQFGRVGAERSA